MLVAQDEYSIMQQLLHSHTGLVNTTFSSNTSKGQIIWRNQIQLAWLQSSLESNCVDASTTPPKDLALKNHTKSIEFKSKPKVPGSRKYRLRFECRTQTFCVNGWNVTPSPLGQQPFSLRLRDHELKQRQGWQVCRTVSFLTAPIEIQNWDFLDTWDAETDPKCGVWYSVA